MSQPTYDRLVSHLDRLGIARAKDNILKDAEQNADGHAAKDNVLLLGPPGVSKTHLAVAPRRHRQHPRRQLPTQGELKGGFVQAASEAVS